MGSQTSQTIDTDYFYKDAQQKQYSGICKIETKQESGSMPFGTGILLAFDEKECVNNDDQNGHFKSLARRVLCGPLSTTKQHVVLTAKHVVPVESNVTTFANTRISFDDGHAAKVLHGIDVNGSVKDKINSVKPDLMLLFPAPLKLLAKSDLQMTANKKTCEPILDVKIIGHGCLGAIQYGNKLVYDTNNAHPNAPKGVSKATKTLDVVKSDQEIVISGDKQTNLLLLDCDRKRNHNHVFAGPGDSGAPLLSGTNIIGVYIGARHYTINSTISQNIKGYALDLSCYTNTIKKTIYRYRYFDFYATAASNFMYPFRNTLNFRVKI